jgi:hypothetical protein
VDLRNAAVGDRRASDVWPRDLGNSIASTAVFFVIGLVLLRHVDIERGAKQALERAV